MAQRSTRFRFFGFAVSPAQTAGLVLSASLALNLCCSVKAQQQDPAQQQNSPAPSAPEQPASQQSPPAQAPASAPEAVPPATPPDTQAAPAPAQPTAPAAASPSVPPSAATHASASQPSQPAEISEDEVRKLVTGKELFLRGGYLDNSLSFNEHGLLIGHSPQGSYTLSGIEINKVRLTRHKVELEGQRFGLHFLGALPSEDPTKAVDRVNITPKKKIVKITVDRELVVKPKQAKDKKKSARDAAKPGVKPNSPAPATAAAQPAPASTVSPTAPPADSASAEAQAEIAAVPPAERPADPNSVTTTTSVAHANKLLRDAIDNVFAQGFDARMMDAMPGFWKLYYQAATDKADYNPSDSTVLRQNMVDQKARLTSTFEPASNQFAQDYGVAGMSEYHVVIGADGKPGEIAVARPIGFGLDESAVDSIRKATFEPALKDGKPVPVMLDLVMEFHIYSKRTNIASSPAAPDQNKPPALPGPYSIQH